MSKTIHLSHRITAIFISFLMLTSMIVLPESAVLAYAETMNFESSGVQESNGYEYKFNSDGTASITGYTGTDTIINIPSEIKGRTVTEIYKEAFKNKNITEVTIPDTVVVLGDNSFSWCSNLSKVTLPNSVKTINNAFVGDSSLESVTLPQNVENLYFAFWGCSGLTEITIPGTVNNLTYSFYNCTNLKTVIIKNGVEKIDVNAFTNCTNLTSVTIPSTVTSIDDTAFYNASQFYIRGVSGSYAEQYAKSKNITFESTAAPTYEWSDDYSLCTATRIINTETYQTETETKETDYTVVTVSTCEEKGEGKFTATFSNEAFEKQTKNISIDPIGHDYGEPEWQWSDDYSNATALFVCKNDQSHNKTVNATVTIKTTAATCETAGKMVYTATATFNGKPYTDTKEVAISAKGHRYELTGWNWDNYDSATATFTCDNNSLHMLKLDADITSTQENDSTITHTAVVVLDGTEYSDSKTEKITMPETDNDGDKTSDSDEKEYMGYFVINGGLVNVFPYGESKTAVSPVAGSFSRYDDKVNAHKEDDGTYTITFEICPSENYKFSSVDDITIDGDYGSIRQSVMIGTQALFINPNNTFTVTNVQSDLTINIT